MCSLAKQSGELVGNNYLSIFFALPQRAQNTLIAMEQKSARLTGPATERVPVSTMVSATAASTNGLAATPRTRLAREPAASRIGIRPSAAERIWRLGEGKSNNATRVRKPGWRALTILDSHTRSRIVVLP
jgi:hypothetical protein